MSSPTPRYATLAQAAEYLSCNERTIRRHIAAGRLAAYRLGKRAVRVDLNQVDGMLLQPIPTAHGGGDAA